MQEFQVGEADSGKRADVFIAKKYPQFSRTALKGLFERRQVYINDQAAKAGQKLKVGDRVSVDEVLLKAQPPMLDLPLIYEDSDVVVINKPAGTLTHSKGALNLEPTVASFLKTKISDKSLSGNRAGIVHRLDRGTSGVIIAAKTAAALEHLQKQFSARKVKKTYLAIVEGRPQPAEAIIDAAIGRNPKKPQTFKVMPAGRQAKTKYKVLRQKAGQSLVELVPLTGRTHQLRVHMAYIGHPIVGDSVYGRGDGEIMLHAYKLELTLSNGQRKTFMAPLPTKLKGFGK